MASICTLDYSAILPLYCGVVNEYDSDSIPVVVFYTFSCLFSSKSIIESFFFFLASLGLRCCAWAFSSCTEQRLLFVVVHSLLTVVASLVVEHGL